MSIYYSYYPQGGYVSMKNVRLKDIAKALGLSVSTVSRALNKKGKVRLETIKLVEKKAEELGYLPNSVAKGLKTRSTHIIGLLIPDITNPIFPEYAQGILDTASKYGYQVIMLNTYKDRSKERAAISSLLSNQVDGIILTSTKLLRRELVDLRNKGVSFVVTRREVSIPDISFVDVDNLHGGYSATEYLIKTGRKKIAFVGSSFSGEPARRRLRGYMKALKKYGIQIRDEWIIEGENSFEGGYKIAQKIAYSVEAIFAYNDIMAIGALIYAAENDIKVPEDLAIIGFDDIPFSSLPMINLTTMKQPMYEMGRQAFEILINLMKDKTGVHRIWLKSILVKRGTA